MDSKRLKGIDVIVSAENDEYKVSAVKRVCSPLYVSFAKALLLERLSRGFMTAGLTFHVNVVRVYE